MRHHNVNRKFGRTRKVRTALLRGLALNLVVRGRIRTTEAKAKELRPFVEKLVTKAKNPNLANQRALVSKLLNQRRETKKLFERAAKYQDKKGGYTRILKLGRRTSDGSKMAIIEFV